MKISFLIPTKNRLELLKLVMASILDQRLGEWEIVVSDNASVDDYAAYIASLNDERIRYFRQPSPVSVTENWQKAFELATGDYIFMLGDDDAIAPDFMANIVPWMAPSGPDLIYVAGYHYCYPDVIPGSEKGFLASVFNSEFLPKDEPFELDKAYAVGLVDSLLQFYVRFGMNAQHFIVKRSFALQFNDIGGFYQSPYPDTFSAMAVWLKADSIRVIPKEQVIIGISPKSFGAYYFSGRHDEGYKFLDNEHVDASIRKSFDSVILPGDRNNTTLLVAISCARTKLSDYVNSDIGTERYRVLQMIHLLRASFLGGDTTYLQDLRSALTHSERIQFDVLEAVLSRQNNEGRNKSFEAISEKVRLFVPAKIIFHDIGSHSSIWDAYQWIKQHGEAAGGAKSQKVSETPPQIEGANRTTDKAKRPRSSFQRLFTRLKKGAKSWN